MSELTMISLFAGIGGIDLGFKKAGIDCVWANEIDPYCALTFKANNKNVKLIVEDICKISSKDIPTVDILAGGFPCQPFSVAGHRKGFDDDRGSLFFQITRILDELKAEERLPKVVFLENVKNLFNHNNGETYKHIKKELKRIGYYVVEKIMNTCDYGNIPQNRERLYIIGFLDKNSKDNFKWPEKIELTNTLDKVINWDEKVDKKYYYNSDMKCYPLLKENVIHTNAIYQFRRVYVRENKSGICPTLTANMGMGGHNVPIIKNEKGDIRKLTPRECLKIQGFPENFIIPKELCDSRVYKQAGNSVSVNVIKRIADEIKRVVEDE